MKKRKNAKKRLFQIVGTIGIASVFLAIVLIIVGNFTINEKENISKADNYSEVKIGLTNFGGDYGLTPVTASAVTNHSSKQIMTISSSFYNYRYDHEIEKGWRDQGIAGELSGVQSPFSKFNDKLSEYYKNNNGSTLYGMYVGNFYNHWKGSYNAKNYDWCLKNYTAFHWAQNIANRRTYSAVCQGLVGISTEQSKTDLVDYEWSKDNFNPGTIMCSNGSTPLPFFNQAFLNEKNSTSDKLSIGVVAEKVGFPFRYAHDSQKGSYYVFDSKYDVVSFSGNESNGCTDKAYTYKYYYGKEQQSDDLDEKPTLNYYYQQNQIHTRQNKTPQFLPLNGTNANGDPAKLDFGFGMRVDIPFYLTADGKQLAADGGNPMKFNFEGDDDVWVFIDGKLVLDLGGAHAKTKGSIDFSTAGNYVTAHAETVAYQKDTEHTTAGTDCFENAGHNTDVKACTNNTIPVKKDAVHVLTVFYMERGMIESNLYMDFNFIPHNEEVDVPNIDEGDTLKTTSDLTVKTEVTSAKVASCFSDKIQDLIEDDAFQYKIENTGTKSGNVGDSDIKYPSGLLSVRENRGKRTYWSFGEPIEPSKVRVYFDLDSVKTIDNSEAPSGKQRRWFWETTQPPYINENYITDKADPMTQYTYTDTAGNIVKTQLYYADVPVGKPVTFHNGYKNGDTEEVTVWDHQENVNKRVSVKATEAITKDSDGKVYKVSKLNRDNGDITGEFDSTPSCPGCPDIDVDKIHSLNLPYETTGSVFNFNPMNANGYNLVTNTSYQLNECYLAANETYNETMKDNTDIRIFQNNPLTSGKTDNKGIFSLLNKDSAIFKNQFRVNSNMRIVQQDKLGVVDRDLPTEETTAGPKVTASKDSGSFTDPFTLTLTPVNATKATYSINGEEKVEFTAATTIPIGDDCAIDDTVVVKVTAVGTNGSMFNKKFTYVKKEHKFCIRVKKSDFSSGPPYLHLYNKNDGSTDTTWPGVAMTPSSDGYYYSSDDFESANIVINNNGSWQYPPKDTNITVSGYTEYDKTNNTFYDFAVPGDSVITTGKRKTADFYYSTISTKDKNDNEITTSKTGEFKFANVDGSTDKIVINETFTNQVKTGNLCIAKEVTGMKNTSGTYSFTIKFKDVFGVSDGEYKGYALDYKKYDANNTETAGKLVDSNPTVELKSGEKIIIKGIPAGTKYQIIEGDTNTDASKKAVTGKISVSYDTKVNGETQLITDSGTEITKLETGQTGTIEGMIPTSVTNSATSETVNEFDEVDVNVTFTNQKGVLRIEKLAIGEWKNFKNEEYTFTITGDDAINSYTYDVYEYDQKTGKSQIAKDKDDNNLENISITDGKIKLKATQWVLIQDIPLTEGGKNYTITETEGNYYKLDSIDVNAGVEAVSANIAEGTISMKLSWTNPNADVTFINRYDPAYITINKYVDALYYQIHNEGKTDTTDKLYSDVTGDKITYQDLTDAKQSFIFTIDEYNTGDDAMKQTNKVNTFQIAIPIQDSNEPKESNKLSSPITFYGKTYRYKNSKTIKLTLGRFYRISEDTNWSWKYNLQRIETVFSDTTGNVHDRADNCIVFEGGSDAKIPVINFYNTLTTDTTKLSTDGDTDVVVNIIKPDN